MSRIEAAEQHVLSKNTPPESLHKDITNKPQDNSHVAAMRASNGGLPEGFGSLTLHDSRPTAPKPGDSPTVAKSGDNPTAPKSGDSPTAPKPGDTPTAPKSWDTQPHTRGLFSEGWGKVNKAGDTPTSPKAGDTTIVPKPGDTTTVPKPGDAPIAPKPGDTPTAPKAGRVRPDAHSDGPLKPGDPPEPGLGHPDKFVYKAIVAIGALYVALHALPVITVGAVLTCLAEWAGKKIFFKAIAEM